MKVIWEVEDGYAGKSRPHTTEIDDAEYFDVHPDERQDFVEECVQEDFNNRVTWFIQRQEEPEGEDPYAPGGEYYEEE